jgi:hypothetical protein
MQEGDKKLVEDYFNLSVVKPFFIIKIKIYKKKNLREHLARAVGQLVIGSV